VDNLKKKKKNTSKGNTQVMENCNKVQSYMKCLKRHDKIYGFHVGNTKIEESFLAFIVT